MMTVQNCLLVKSTPAISILTLWVTTAITSCFDSAIKSNSFRVRSRSIILSSTTCCEILSDVDEVLPVSLVAPVSFTSSSLLPRRAAKKERRLTLSGSDPKTRSGRVLALCLNELCSCRFMLKFRNVSRRAILNVDVFLSQALPVKRSRTSSRTLMFLWSVKMMFAVCKARC